MQPGHGEHLHERSPAPQGTQAAAHTYPRLLLASRSPRRRELLTLHNIDHEAEHPGFDDTHLQPGDTTPRAWVTSLANLKALAGLEQLAAQGRVKAFDYVLGADTTCVRDGTVLGTPHDVPDARRIITTLRDGDHEVITGVALICTATRKRTLFADRATVTVGKIPDDHIDDYIASGKWHGKAGAYNLDERIAAGWPITYAGDPTTITGLPMDMLIRVLGRLARTPAVPTRATAQHGP